MCRRRFINKSFTQCEHVVTVEEMSVCEDRFCKFSPSHLPDCIPPQCTKSCWQYRQFPERYSLSKEGKCPDCQS